MRAAAEAVAVCASVRGRGVVEGAEADAEPEAAVPLVFVFRVSIASDVTVEETAGRLEAGSREAGRVQPVSASKKDAASAARRIWVFMPLPPLDAKTYRFYFTP